MEVWRLKSNKSKQTALAIGCTTSGAILMYLAYGRPDTNAKAGFVLGAMLALIGLYAFFTGGTQTVTIDPDTRLIDVETINHFGSKKQTIAFDDIADITVGFLGRRSNFVKFYYLVLKLRDGKEYTLFSPGYFYSGSNKETVEGWRDRLWEYIRSSRMNQ